MRAHESSHGPLRHVGGGASDGARAAGAAAKRTALCSQRRSAPSHNFVYKIHHGPTTVSKRSHTQLSSRAAGDQPRSSQPLSSRLSEPSPSHSTPQHSPASATRSLSPAEGFSGTATKYGSSSGHRGLEVLPQDSAEGPSHTHSRECRARATGAEDRWAQIGGALRGAPGQQAAWPPLLMYRWCCIHRACSLQKGRLRLEARGGSNSASASTGRGMLGLAASVLRRPASLRAVIGWRPGTAGLGRARSRRMI